MPEKGGDVFISKYLLCKAGKGPQNIICWRRYLKNYVLKKQKKKSLTKNDTLQSPVLPYMIINFSFPMIGCSQHVAIKPLTFNNTVYQVFSECIQFPLCSRRFPNRGK